MYRNRYLLYIAVFLSLAITIRGNTDQEISNVVSKVSKLKPEWNLRGYIPLVILASSPLTDPVPSTKRVEDPPSPSSVVEMGDSFSSSSSLSVNRKLQSPISRVEYNPQIADDDISTPYILPLRFMNKIYTDHLRTSAAATGAKNSVASVSTTASGSLSEKNSLTIDSNSLSENEQEDDPVNEYDDDDDDDTSIIDNSRYSTTNNHNNYVHSTLIHRKKQSSSSDITTTKKNHHHHPDDHPRVLVNHEYFGIISEDNSATPYPFSSDTTMNNNNYDESRNPSVVQQGIRYIFIHSLGYAPVCSNQIFHNILLYSLICTLSFLSGITLLYTIILPQFHPHNDEITGNGEDDDGDVTQKQQQSNSWTEHSRKVTPHQYVCTINCDVQSLVPQHHPVHIQ